MSEPAIDLCESVLALHGLVDQLEKYVKYQLQPSDADAIKDICTLAREEISRVQTAAMETLR